MKISCVTASYLAEQLGYPSNIDWGPAVSWLEKNI